MQRSMIHILLNIDFLLILLTCKCHKLIRMLSMFYDSEFVSI